MCTIPHTETRPPPPIPYFLLVQNLSSKRIVPTNNMWPKLYNIKWHNLVIEGLQHIERPKNKPNHYTPSIYD